MGQHFMGISFPIKLLDMLNQNKRWAMGLLEVAFSKYSPIAFGKQDMGLLKGLAYAYSGLWPIWSIPITIYAFLPTTSSSQRNYHLSKGSIPFQSFFKIIYIKLPNHLTSK